VKQRRKMKKKRDQTRQPEEETAFISCVHRSGSRHNLRRRSGARSQMSKTRRRILLGLTNRRFPTQHLGVPVRRRVDPCPVGGRQPCPVPNVNHPTSAMWPAAVRRAGLKKSTYTHRFPSRATDQQGRGRWPTGNRWWPGEGRQDPSESPVRQST
jgi:hypothetical protein